MTEIEKAAKALVEKLELVHQHPAYVGVWTLAHMHGGPYAGPNYVEELKALKEALAKEPPDNWGTSKLGELTDRRSGNYEQEKR